MTTYNYPKFGAGLWHFANYVDRYAVDGYGPALSTLEQIKAAKEVGDLSYVDVPYPFSPGVTISQVKEALADAGLKAIGITPEIYLRKWSRGAFTNPDPVARAEALKLMNEAADVVRELGASYVKVWPGQDGWDYPFQVDHKQLWKLAVDGMRELASANPDVKFAIEYKPREPRVKMTWDSAARTLLGIEDIGLDNVGILLDFGHALFGGESPADSAQLIIDRGRLFGMDVNDNLRGWDDDLVGLGFLNYGGDFARYLPKKTPASKVIFWTTAGISFPVSILLILGTLLADSNPDLSAAAAQSPISSLTDLLPMWFYVPFSVVIIISLLSAAITGIYSSGLALLALGLPVSRAATTAINALIIGFGAFYLMFISDSFLSTFQSFLASISVVIGSAGAIQLIDFVRQKRLGWDVTLANKPESGGRSGRWTALLALCVATLVGLGTITSSDPYIAHIVGFLLTDEARKSLFATANIGVIVSMVTGGGIYALLTFVLKIESVSASDIQSGKLKANHPQKAL